MAAAVVLEGDARGVADRVCHQIAAAGGLRIQTGWRHAGPGVVCAGLVDDEQAAEQAVLASLAGAAVVATATAPRDVIDRMCDDLRRLGPLDHRVADSASRPALSDEEGALLERLLAGDSLGQAAATVHVSRRTADRRIAGLRSALGVTTTAELLAAAAKLGFGPPLS